MHFQSIADEIPHPVWTQNADGTISWSNAAFEQLKDCELSPNIFANSYKVTAEKKGVSAQVKEDQEDWYDIESYRFNSGVLQVALNANKAVQDETARAEFVQTLTKTFAHLSTALIIFDKSRNLALFNPALLDLTGLPFEFLSQRPHLYSFLDRLREEGVVPEPKDYAIWREQMAQLESAAQDGTYCETWELANGSTFRITGRPHPNGAIALLMEDISNEVALARKFRYEIDLTRKVLDTIDEAIAVFSETGTMFAVNEAYVDLWGVDPEESVLDVSVNDCLKTWLDRAAPNPAWGDLRDFLSQTSNQSEWQTQVQLRAGRVYRLRCVPLPGGATVIGFSKSPSVARSLSKEANIQVAAAG